MARKTAKSSETIVSSETASKAQDTTAKPRRAKTTRKRANSSKAAKDRALVIVESPKKAKSIHKFLGNSYVVKASMGHVRDLPDRKLGVDVEQRYKPTYVVPERKKSTVTELKKEAAKVGMVYLATDPDREGEAIAWHLQQALDLPDDRVRRVQFFEITERAIREAFDHVGPIDMSKVNAQQARRFLDRFVGYQLSPLLWKKVARGLSAGRVQSVAVRLIAEREKEIRAFVPEEYWRIGALLSQQGAESEADRFESELTSWQGAKFSAKNEAEATAVHQALTGAPFVVDKLETVERRDRPDAPFKTSTLQQQGTIRLRFSGKRTMVVAQQLYEGIDVDGSGPTGLITYMRTDSLRVSDDAVKGVREKIQSDYGDAYLPAKPIAYAAGKLAQEAHEAIRPTDLSLTPESIRDRLTPDQFKLYDLIYRRFVASQMAPARFEVTNVSIRAGEGLFKTQGRILRFDGYRRVLPPAGKQEDQLLPALEVGQTLDLHALTPSQHFTQPPPRFSEATLIRALEKENIGRPSTYAPIIQTIQDRNYVEQKERRFFATDLGMVVTDLLVEHFPKIMDLKFTAQMEDELDGIVTGKEEFEKVLDEFYHPFQDALKTAEGQMEKVAIPSEETCPECDSPMVMKFTKTGPFLSCTRYPECKGTKRADGSTRAEAVETEHKCPECGKPLVIREGKRGEFLACSGYPKCSASFNLDEEGNPVPSVIPTDHPCPKCGKPMALRQSARGPFLGCTGYPKCRTTLPANEKGEPITPPSVDVKCPKCQGPMTVKPGRRGPFLGCLGYPKCRGTAPIPEELKDKLGDFGGSSSTQAADLKAIQVEETCEDCGGSMVVRRGRRGFFLGCANYPKCRGTKEPGEATMEKITAVTSG